ncbi:MAG: penicillin acylase family protein [Acidobacteria bacterium]|nr:penicillin acylase family protein [Acidobacteriota bacterium]
MHGRLRFVLVVFLSGVILLPVLLFGHIRFYSQRSRLPESGREQTRLRGIHDRVTIALDGGGVPHIDAATAEDLWFAQGYVHARDRFFQMELGRRMAAGRLSEIFGEASLSTDRRMRTLRLAATAGRQAAALEGVARRTLERYSDGVNAALREYGRWVAPELWLLGIEPDAWGVEDSLSIGLLLELNSTWAMGDEIKRSVELTHLGRDKAVELWGWGPEEQRRWIPPVDLPSRAPEGEDAILPAFGGGSNSWAIGPARTATGRPLLANDPHIAVAVPGTWYAVGLRAPGIRVSGASIAGMPGVLIGHNRRVAWGFTMSMMDDQDLYVLTLDESRDRELVDDAWIPLRTVTETIEVRWRSEPETMKVRISRHGPVVRDTRDSTLALAWTGLKGPGGVDAFLQMARADSVEDLAEAWRDAAGPSMNLVAADVEGHILHQVVGRRPRRLRGAGRLPSPGSDSAWAWNGLAPFSENPSMLDPEESFVGAANHDLFSEGDYGRSRAFPADFAAPWRIRRIRHVLSSRADWDVESCLNLQGDVVSGRAVALLKALWPDLERHGGPTAAALLDWDGRMEVDRVEPLLFNRLILELALEIGQDEAFDHGLDRTPFDAERILRLLAGGLGDAWWDDVRTDAVEERTMIVDRCLDRLDSLDHTTVWGDVHQVDFSHVLADFPLVGTLLRLAGHRHPVGVPGDGTTVNAHYWDKAQPFSVMAIPSMRFVADVGDWDRSVLTLPLGQSGRPWSPHAADQFSDWLAVRGRTLPFSREMIEAETRAELVLMPR